MAPAVSVISSSGRSPKRTIHKRQDEQGQDDDDGNDDLDVDERGQGLVGGVEGDGGDQGASGYGHGFHPVGRAPHPGGDVEGGAVGDIGPVMVPNWWAAEAAARGGAGGRMGAGSWLAH